MDDWELVINLPYSYSADINSGLTAGMISNPRLIVGRKVESSGQQIIRAIFIFLTHSQQSTVNSQQSFRCNRKRYDLRFWAA
jgi:hypothetical protein